MPTVSPAHNAIYTATCLRCGKVIEGSWMDIERAGAWQHYRSGR